MEQQPKKKTTKKKEAPKKEAPTREKAWEMHNAGKNDQEISDFFGFETAKDAKFFRQRSKYVPKLK